MSLATTNIVSSEVAETVRTGDYLGPATVVGLDDDRLTVELPDGSVIGAETAFVIPYHPAQGDVLLVIAKGSRGYAIGVLHGTGKTVLALQGDVELRAEGGELKLLGEKGVTMIGPDITLQANKITTLAESLTQKVGSFVQRVRGLLHTHSKESHTLVDEAAVTKAKSAAVLTEETMTINGKQIHLG